MAQLDLNSGEQPTALPGAEEAVCLGPRGKEGGVAALGPTAVLLRGLCYL